MFPPPKFPPGRVIAPVFGRLAGIDGRDIAGRFAGIDGRVIPTHRRTAPPPPAHPPSAAPPPAATALRVGRIGSKRQCELSKATTATSGHDDGIG